MATLFFDLDGTLIDSALGITRCVTHALVTLEQPVPDEAELRRWIGPALRVSFLPLLKDADRVEQAVKLYLERFDEHGWREHELYDGVGAVVETLHAEGHRLAVVTAKNEPHARRIVAHLPFGNCFEDVVGSTQDGRLTHKHELVGEALRRLQPAAAPLMIGDRHMDVEGARAHGLDCVGVAWGFGEEAELRGAGARWLARTPAELLAAVHTFAGANG